MRMWSGGLDPGSGPASFALPLSGSRGSTLIAVVGEGRHELRFTGQGLLLEVGTLQAVSCCCPFLRVIHEKEIEQTKSGLREPRELVLEVVVGLFPQAVLASQRQPGETRPDILTRCPQQLYNQVNLVDLRSAREKGLMGQQLCQDAANSPVEAADLC